MKKLIFLLPLLLTACITPDARKFPDIPPELKQACPDLQEIDPTIYLESNLEPVHIKNHKQAYYDMYTKAINTAKELKKNAIKAFLEAKNIKNTYLLDTGEDLEEEGRI